MKDFKKTLMSLLLVGLAASAGASGPFRPAILKPWQKSATEVAALRNTTITARTADEIPTVTVIDEDFSGFAAGSENQPDEQSIGGPENPNWKITGGYMKTEGWTGGGVHQAGGACALLPYKGTYGQSYGYISTPEMELYGECVVTFRAKRTAQGGGDLWVVLCDNEEGPIYDEEIDCYLTSEWQQFELRTTKATFKNNSIFQFTAQKGSVLIDDIKITRKRNVIPQPEMNNARNISQTEFVASWLPTATAEKYLFNVYYKDMPDGEHVSGTIVESFEGINATADGKINVSSPNYPEGWNISLSAAGSKEITTAAGQFCSGKQGLVFDAEGDYIESADAPAPLKKLSFWIKPSVIDDDEEPISLLQVSILHRNGRWEAIANLPSFYLEEEGVMYQFGGDVLGDDVTRVRFELIQKNKVTFYIDDVTMDYETQPVPYPLITDEELTDTFRIVKDVDPAYDYFYYVQAKEGNIVSEVAYHVWVDGLTGLKPSLSAPADVTGNSFTAKWEKMAKADRYEVNLYESFLTTKAGEEVTLIEENFNKATEGTIDTPCEPEGWDYSFNLYDLGLAHTGWQARSLIWANGMVGGKASWYDGVQGGTIISPALKLADGGDVKVTINAVSMREDGKLTFVIMDDPMAYMAIMAIENIPFATTGQVEKLEAVFPAEYINGYMQPGKDYYISIFTTGGAFFLDDVKVTQVRNNAGETVYAPCDVMIANTTSHTFTGLKTGSTYAYSVKALRTKDFEDYMSDMSDIIEVVLGTDGIDSPMAAHPGNGISVGDGQLSVTMADSGIIRICDMQGRTLRVISGQSGINTTTLPAGLYIVNAEGKTTKVVVK
ncbi:MAG: T9SS type A sorting domain-containing protein [Prevotella sp.]|nr:T9SS type A sorting domain-containing protein [Prevotella sp.]